MTYVLTDMAVPKVPLDEVVEVAVAAERPEEVLPAVALDAAAVLVPAEVWFASRA